MFFPKHRVTRVGRKTDEPKKSCVNKDLIIDLVWKQKMYTFPSEYSFVSVTKANFGVGLQLFRPHTEQDQVIPQLSGIFQHCKIQPLWLIVFERKYRLFRPL